MNGKMKGTIVSKKKSQLQQIQSIFDESCIRHVLLDSKIVNSSGCLHNSNNSESIEEVNEISLPINESPSMKEFRCRICQIKFEDLYQQRAHFKSDWHKHNIQLEVSGKKPVDEPSFENSSDEEESLTDSDDEPDFEKERKSKIEFISPMECKFSIYRALLEDDRKEGCINCVLMETALLKLGDDACWMILMMSGGHFAAAVFHRQEVVHHKAIHRYTVRAKSGTVQSKCDGKQSGKSPKSAGSNIRRQNEIALVAEIQELLRKWKDHVQHADKIFMRWPQQNKSILFSGKNPILTKADARLKKIPFMTGKPTFEELKRIHRELSTVTFQDDTAMKKSQGKSIFENLMQTKIEHQAIAHKELQPMPEQFNEESIDMEKETFEHDYHIEPQNSLQ